MDKDICFILCSCDSYDDLWTPFCMQLVKYWPGFDLPIFLSTETKSFHYDGLRIETPLKGVKTDLSSWSKRLEALLNLIPYDYFIFMLDDFLLTGDVNVKEVAKAYSYMKADDNIGLIHLWPLISENSNKIRRENVVDCEYPGYYRVKNKMPYRITTQVAIWRKDYMLKILRTHESAWHFEVRGTIRSRFYREEVLAIKNRVMDYPAGGLIWRGRCCIESMQQFDTDVIRGCVEKRGTIQANALSTMRKKTPRNLRFFINLAKSFSPRINWRLR